MKNKDDVTTIVFRGIISLELNKTGGVDFSQATPIALMKGNAIEINEEKMAIMVEECCSTIK